MQPKSIPVSNDILEQINDAVIAIDNEHRVTYLNPAAERQYGVSAAEIVGRQLAEMHSYEWLDPLEETAAANRLLEHGFWRGENIHTTNGGRRLHVESTVTRLSSPDGSPIGLLAVIRDITDRKHAEEQLRRNHETFYNLIVNAPFGVYVIDADFRLVEISAGSRKVFAGVDPLIGRDFAEIIRTIWSEPFATEAIGKFRHTLDSGESYRAADTRKQRENIGDLESYDWRIERVVLPDGRFGVVCYFYDLTERLEFETALLEAERAKQQQSHLEHIVNAQESERHRLARDLHDHLGQEITGLRLALENLVADGTDADRLNEQIESLKNRARQLDRDVTFLAFEMRPAVLNNLGLADALRTFISEWSTNYRIPADTHIKLPDRFLAPDIENNLYRVMQEAFNNIVKHANADQVSFILEIGDDEIVMIIEDFGVGFDPTVLNGNSGPDKHGHGLMGMKERAEMLNGRLTVESSPGLGTTVFFKVPAQFVTAGSGNSSRKEIRSTATTVDLAD
jgi:PAS domain S-box-containing protein